MPLPLVLEKFGTLAIVPSVRTKKFGSKRSVSSPPKCRHAQLQSLVAAQAPVKSISTSENSPTAWTILVIRELGARRPWIQRDNDASGSRAHVGSHPNRKSRSTAGSRLIHRAAKKGAPVLGAPFSFSSPNDLLQRASSYSAADFIKLFARYR